MMLYLSFINGNANISLAMARGYEPVLVLFTCVIIVLIACASVNFVGGLRRQQLPHSEFDILYQWLK